MREAHEFGSLESYARWLIEQPDDVYPLIRMPRQVVGAVRARNRGVPDHKLRTELKRAQKDVLFLYYLHDQPNTRALMDREALSLRVIILVKEIRALINERHAVDQIRLERVDLEGSKHGRPGYVEKDTRAHYRAHLGSWLPEAEGVRTGMLEFLAAARLISRRYFTGADILYPEIRENLTWNLSTIAGLIDTFADLVLACRQSDNQFRDYVLALLDDQAEPGEPDSSAGVSRAAPDVRARAKALAEQWVLMAKSKALEKLGEQDAAERIAHRLIREHMG